MFEVGKKYKVKPWPVAQSSILCIAVHGNFGWFKGPATTPYTCQFSGSWKEVEEEKWVAMWWTDKFKTNINTSSQFFASEKKAIEWAESAWYEDSPFLFIKAVKVSED